MKASVLLPTSGDPLLARYWLRNFETWRDQVDELLVYVNGDVAGTPIYEAAGARIVGSTATRLIHGVALTELVRAVQSDVCVLMEDDAFVRRPSQVRDRLLRVAWRDDDIIGCPRGGMSPELHAAAQSKWGQIDGPDTSSGPGLWPCFLFARPDDLRSVPDMRFGSISWAKGDVIPGLGYEAQDIVTTDTMTLMAYQLRERFKITADVQYKEMWQKDLGEMTDRTGDPPWFHAGGLANEPATIRPDIGMDNNEGLDWAHRFWWWRRIGHDYSEHHRSANLDPDYWTPIVEPWINWEDR